MCSVTRPGGRGKTRLVKYFCVMLNILSRLVPVQLEAGSSSDKVVVVAGEGLRPRDSIAGDLRVHTAIRVPTKLDQMQSRSTVSGLSHVIHCHKPVYRIIF